MGELRQFFFFFTVVAWLDYMLVAGEARPGDAGGRPRLVELSHSLAADELPEKLSLVLNRARSDVGCSPEVIGLLGGWRFVGLIAEDEGWARAVNTHRLIDLHRGRVGAGAAGNPVGPSRPARVRHSGERGVDKPVKDYRSP